MRIKAAYKYQLMDSLKGLGVFYITIVAIYVIFGGAVNLFVNGKAQVSGLDSATGVFLFVLGLCTFKEIFLFMQQNGASRKSLFVGRVLSFAVISGMAAVIDRVLGTLSYVLQPAGHFGSGNGTIFSAIYPVSGAGGYIVNILFSFVAYFCIAMVGYTITLVFYRLNKIGKIAVGVGVPVVLMNALPMLDYWVFGGVFFQWLYQFLKDIYGLTSGQPWYGVLTNLVLAGLFSLFSWLLMRRAEVK